MLRDALFASRKNPKGFRAVLIRLVVFGEWEAVFVAFEDLQMLLFAVLLAFQDENDQESMKIVKKIRKQGYDVKRCAMASMGCL